MLPGKVSLLSLPRCQLGEVPHWDSQTNTLLYVDINQAVVNRWNPVSNAFKKIKVKGVPTVGAVVPRERGGLVVAAGQRFGFLNEETGDLDIIHTIDAKLAGTRFNDGKCDPFGRFWAGTMGEEKEPGVPVRKQGSLYCLDTNGRCHERIKGSIDISNGLSWTSDHSIMYYCDSLKYSIDAYDYEISTGCMSNPRSVIKFDQQKGIPDGHCIDTEGNLWVALYFGSGLVKVDPRRGEIIGEIKVSETAHQTTSVCFGGPNMDEMYMTSATSKNPVGVDDEGGRLFKITETGSKGFAANIYQG